MTSTATCSLAPGLAPLAQARPGQRAPVLALARRCCPLLLRPLYRWGKATLTSGHDLWQEATGQTPDQFLTVRVPLRVGFAGGFHFELVREEPTGNWRFSYAYTGRLHELTTSQAAAAQALLTRLGLPGRVQPWWK